MFEDGLLHLREPTEDGQQLRLCFDRMDHLLTAVTRGDQNRVYRVVLFSEVPRHFVTGPSLGVDHESFGDGKRPRQHLRAWDERSPRLVHVLERLLDDRSEER